MNIVAGQARKEIEGESLDARVEAPVIIVCQGLERYPAEKRPVLCLPLSFPVDGDQEILSADFSIA